MSCTRIVTVDVVKVGQVTVLHYVVQVLVLFYEQVNRITEEG